ncbi:MAG: SulP family inorganic anion transporter [bacterium]
MVSKLGFKIFPFFEWFQGYTRNYFRRDLIGGLTVALVLIPQSMAYAQLAGLPAYYGLYAAFIPPMIAALFGSSRQLATGPVAVVSLMTATALEPIATAGSESFIAYAILLALLVGMFQLTLGLLRLGLVVNFLSHPVVSGFTNAAALIIASSQLSKLFGVDVDKGVHHYETIANVIREAIAYTHWPTLALGILAFSIMIILRRVNPRIPSVLIAVVVTTLISLGTGFERTSNTSIEQIESKEVRGVLESFNAAIALTDSIAAERISLRAKLDSLTHNRSGVDHEVLDIEQQITLSNVDLNRLKEDVRKYRAWLRRCNLVATNDSLNQRLFYLNAEVPSELDTDGRCWCLKVGNDQLALNSLAISSGGTVVGIIPQGLPELACPRFDLTAVFSLLPIAIIISLLGFMEAISIAKAMAAKTGQRLDANQELIGQGLANIFGAFSHSYAVSGSFSRSAVNIQAGAVTGLSNVFSSLVVLVVLLFLTPLLYYLPQSVLAAIIMMAVVGLLNLKSFVHAWRAQWYDGFIGLTTFVCTLAFAPHLERGILIGVVLSLLLYLIRNMKPAIAILSLHLDGTYRNRLRFDLKQCPYIVVIRYAGSLIFANVDYLEKQVLQSVRSMPHLRHVLIVGNGINELDASGVDALSVLIDRLHGQGLGFSISGFNDAVLDVLEKTGLTAKIGENSIYHNVTRAIDGIWEKAHTHVNEPNCPLRVRPFKSLPISDKSKKVILARSLEETDKSTRHKKK